MRWQRDPEYIRPYEGAVRTKMRFLLFPKRIHDEWRWWEVAAWQEVAHLDHQYTYWWYPTKWLN